MSQLKSLKRIENNERESSDGDLFSHFLLILFPVVIWHLVLLVESLYYISWG